MAAEVSGPEPAEIVFAVGNEPAERHVASVVAKATIGSVDAVVEPAGAVGVEILEPLHGTAHEATRGRHRCLAHLGTRNRATTRDHDREDQARQW